MASPLSLIGGFVLPGSPPAAFPEVTARLHVQLVHPRLCSMQREVPFPSPGQGYEPLWQWEQLSVLQSRGLPTAQQISLRQVGGVSQGERERK